GASMVPDQAVLVSSGEIHDLLLRVQVDPAQLSNFNQGFSFSVSSRDGVLNDETESRFIGPSTPTPRP
ncbi:MAG: hypothetical protein Q8L06_13020, partial [Pseudohongiella sp.]|nr:hypothetical protein [Pseudohongiella sp.]